MLKIFLYSILLLLIYFPSFLSAASCNAPTATLTLGNTLYNQEIDKPYTQSTSGESLYYKVVIPEDGTFDFSTATDGADEVDTYAYFLDSSCNEIAEASEYDTNPRLVQHTQNVQAGETYFIKVENHVTAQDIITYATGKFKLLNSFQRTIPQREISITKTSPSVVSSGGLITYKIKVTNSGSEDTTNLRVDDYLPAKMHYESMNSASIWDCNIVGSHLACDLKNAVLPSGESRVLYVTAKADYVENDTGTTNRADVDATYVSGSAVDSTTRDVLIKKADVKLALSKHAVATGGTSDISQIVKNNEFDYLFYVSNLSAYEDSNLIMIDEIPSAFSVESIIAPAWDCSASHGQHVECKLSKLDGHHSNRIRLHVKAVGAVSSTPYTNSATVRAKSVLGTDLEATDTADVRIIDQQYDIDFTKTTPQTNVSLNHNTSYRLKVVNRSNMPISGVKIVDDVPNQLEVTSVSGTSWTCASPVSNHVDCQYDLNLGVGQSAFITIYAKAKTIGTNIINTATVSTDNTPDKTDSATINISADVKLALSKHAVGTGGTSDISQIVKNNEFDYLFYVSNLSAYEDSNLIMIDEIPSAFSVESIIAPAWDCSASHGQHVECKLSKLDGHHSNRIRLHVKAVGAVSSTPYTNSATVRAKSVLGTDLEATDTADVRIIDQQYNIDFTKTTPQTNVILNHNTSYRLKVVNRSNMPISGVKIVDNVPNQLEVTSVSGASWTCASPVSNHVNCRYDLNLGVGQSAFITIYAKAKTIGTNIINTATVSTNRTPDKNASTTINISYPSSLLSMSKKASQDIILENDHFTYTLQVKNSGEYEENHLTITDSIPSDFKIDNNISSGSWSCTLNGNNLICTLPTLASHETSDPIEISVYPPSITENKSVQNIAKVTTDRNSVGKTATKSVKLITKNSALTVALSSTPSSVYEGEPFIYSLVMRNNTQESISSIKIEDILPQDVILESIDSGDWDCQYQESIRKISCDNNAHELNGGGYKYIDIKVKAPNYKTHITNTVKVTTDITHEASVTTVVLAKKAALEFSQSDANKDRVGINEPFEYRIKIKNKNTGAVKNDINASNVQVQIALDQNVSAVNISATGWHCNQNVSLITCKLDGSLDIGLESPPIMIEATSSVPHYAITDLNLTSTSQTSGILASIPVDIYDIVTSNLGVTIQDDNDPVEAKRDFAYLIDVSNMDSNNTVNNIDLTLETTSNDTFIYTGLSGSGWHCSQSGTYLYCHLNTLAANSVSSLRIDVKAPDINGTLEVNATVDSLEVDEMNSSNNRATEMTQVLKLDRMQDNLRNFEKVLINGNDNTNIYGDILTIGNQSICEGGENGVCVEPSYKVNDYVDQTNANLDAQSSYENSTAAILDINDTDEVIWAGLYWMGMIDRKVGDGNKIYKADTVHLRYDGENNYQTIKSKIEKFNWKNDFQAESSIFGYQGIAEITNYVKQHRSGKYWVAGVQTSEGYNLSAGWSLVVVIQDKTKTRKLKNITLFDGFQAVWKNSTYPDANQYPDEIEATVTGFLTPKHGDVKAKLTMFGLEGDATLDDSIGLTNKDGMFEKLNNTLNPVDDVMNGTISHGGSIDMQRVPALSNTSGIDIDTFDVSAVIGNGQNTTDIKIASEDDRFYLGMFSFSTELYIPDMCYVQKMTNEDYTDLANGRKFRLGEKIGFEISLKNREHEVAKNITLKVQIDNIFQDTNDTLEIKNIGENSYSKHAALWDRQEVNSTNDQNETVPQTLFDIRVGRYANAQNGGDMKYDDEIFFRYNSTLEGIPDNNQTENIYAISYKMDNMPEVIETQIKKCNDFNQTIYISTEPKGFAVVHKDGSMIDNHLYMQVADHNFSVDILALDDDRQLNRDHRGVVRLDLIDINASIDENASYEEAEAICKSFAVISSQYVSFDNSMKSTPTLSYHDSGENLGFRIVYPVDKYGYYATWSGVNSNTLNDFKTMLDNSYLTKCQSECAASSTLDACRGCIYNLSDTVSKVTCAKDSFAIRPARIMMDTNETLLRGARDYNLTMEANSTGYNKNFAANSIRYTLQKPAGCAVADDNGSLTHNAFGFSDGNASIAPFTYNNVGDINVTLLDTTWTLVDQNATDSNSSDCVMGSSANVPNPNGKYGCNVGGDKIFSFVASAFKNKVNLQNSNGTFTYLDDTGDQRAQAYMTITALLDNNNTATNYTAGCFAKDINYTFNTSLVAGKTEHFYADMDMENNGSANSFKTSEGNFSNGVTSPVLGINFARSKTVAQNPFDLNSSALDINVTDTSGVSGNGFVNSTGIAKYYYMRLYAPDYLNIEDSNFTAGLFYEVYCNEDTGCDKNDANLSTLPESVDHVNWYILNSKHLGTTSDYGSVTAGALNLGDVHTFSMDLNLPSALGRPYCDRITLTPAAYFKYDNYSATMADKLSFKACFISQGSWAGKGDVGMSVDMNVSRKRNSKIDW